MFLGQLAGRLPGKHHSGAIAIYGSLLFGYILHLPFSGRPKIGWGSISIRVDIAFSIQYIDKVKLETKWGKNDFDYVL